MNRVSLNWNDFGQTNKIVNYHTAASFVRGGLIEDPDNSEQFKMMGNAWKAYPLQPYYITRNTRVKFQFSVKVKAQGHAVCVDFDDILSDSRKCIWLTGNEFDRNDPFVNESEEFDLRRSKFANLALGMPATQSSTSHFGISDARKAVDGYINPRWSDSLDIEKNSIAVTNKDVNPFWEVSLPSLQAMSKVIIHEWMQKPLNPFVLKIFNGATVTKSIESSDFTYTGNVHTFSLQDKPQGDKVRIELKQEGILALVEVLILGEEPADSMRQYDIPIGDMILDGVSFGHPVWNGIKVDLAVAPYEIAGSTDAHVLFDTNHILNDVLGETSGSASTDCTIIVHNDQIRNVFTMDITSSIEGFFHKELPPGILGTEVEIQGCIPTNVQVFGSAESIEAGSAFDGSRPAIKYIALIQNTVQEEDNAEEDAEGAQDDLMSESTFSNVELYDNIGFATVETSKVSSQQIVFNPKGKNFEMRESTFTPLISIHSSVHLRSMI